MTTIHNASAGAVIKAVADRFKADVLLCYATAWVESRLNWEAVGDDGTSFGTYQLHKGGELGGQSEAWAKNPLNNARVAIAEIASVEHQHPNETPGQVAAQAQRPANQEAYAANVNAVYNAVKAGRPPAGYLVALHKATGLSISDPDAG